MTAISPSVSVCFLARNERKTIRRAITPVRSLLDGGEILELVVLDESSDGTGAIASECGAQVFRQSSLMGEFGQVLGKGDAMWRSLSVLQGEIIVWLDSDCTSTTAEYVTKLVAPIVGGEADLVKARYRRPLSEDPDGGGRVNHLLARPLLRRFYPELSWLSNPLSGETAMRRSLAMSLPFACGFGVELAHLIDSFELGAAIAEVDLGVHVHRHKGLAELGAMSDELLAVVLERNVPRAGPEPVPGTIVPRYRDARQAEAGVRNSVAAS